MRDLMCVRVFALRLRALVVTRRSPLQALSARVSNLDCDRSISVSNSFLRQVCFAVLLQHVLEAHAAHSFVHGHGGGDVDALLRDATSMVPSASQVQHAPQ